MSVFFSRFLPGMSCYLHWHAGIKAIKLYAWEKPYQQRIQEIRDDELVQVKRMAVISIFNSIIFLGGRCSSFTAFSLFGVRTIVLITYGFVCYCPDGAIWTAPRGYSRSGT